MELANFVTDVLFLPKKQYKFTPFFHSDYFIS